jgi:hypothetical protein
MRLVLKLMTAALLLVVTGTATLANDGPVKFKDPNDNAGGGKPIAADGGEVGKLFMAVFNAIVKKDYNLARELLGKKGDTESILFSDESIKTLFGNDEYSTTAKIVEGFSGDEEVTLFVEFSGGEKSTVQFGRLDDRWDFRGSSSMWQTMDN